jgi:peptide deformylase
MAKLEIQKLNNPLLRRKAQPVTKFDGELQTLIDNMVETMREANGLGLAAPQVNRPISLAVIESLPKVDENGEPIEGTRELFVIANPEIIWESRDVSDGIEGCLSIPGYVGEVTRSHSIRVRAQDRYGQKMRLRLQGWTARIFQHEIDHLKGVLYIDKLTAPENFWTEEEFEKMQKEEEEGQAVESI